MKERLVLLVRRMIYNLRGGFLVRPLAIALVLGCAGALLSAAEEEIPAMSSWVPTILFPSRADPQVAQVILAGIAASIMTVVSIVFAIMLMTLTLASMQFSPRIILSFTRDRVTQWTLGIFLGTFLYCVAALPAARSLPRPFSPVATVLGAIVLALACVCWLLYFIHHISRAINVNQIVDKIASETESIIDGMMPSERRERSLRRQKVPPELVFETAIPSPQSGYIRFVDLARLLDIASSYRISVHVLRRVGQFVPQGVPLIAVSRAERLPPGGSAALLGAFDLGPSRTLQQDVEFGVLQIVDIALRAISPAVNDPSTAISCIDQLSRILIRFASREAPESVLFDLPGAPRVVVPWMEFDRLTDGAFEQVRLYSQGDFAVSLRLLRAFADIAATLGDTGQRSGLLERGRRVVSGCGTRLGEPELAHLKSRLGALEQAAAAPSARVIRPRNAAGREPQ
jgi:uncharacterized membrane protein